MSEYQYYEFKAIDHRLDEADRVALRALSSRAQITATSFKNAYDWGDFRGDPAATMARWFDLHVYVASWGTRRLMVRLPKRLVEGDRIGRLLSDVQCAETIDAGDNLILDIRIDEDGGFDDWDDGTAWLAALQGLRDDILAGDMRFFYLLWLTAVELDLIDADALEPLAGLAPMSGALAELAEFLCIDPDLLAAAAEASFGTDPQSVARDAIEECVKALSEKEKDALLLRLLDGDQLAAAELRKRARDDFTPAATSAGQRTASQLRARAQAIRADYEQAQAQAAAAERARKAEAAEQERRERLTAIAGRGETVWGQVEAEIERRNTGSYARALALLHDLGTITEERGTRADFDRRIALIRERHVRKVTFVERLDALRDLP